MIAEVVSAFAVVISLVYVGLEIRQSSLVSEADVQAELLSYTTQRRYLVIENPDLAELLVKGYEDPGRLASDELLRFQNYIELFYVVWERAYMTWEAGVLSDGMFQAWNGWFASVARNDPDFVWPMVRGAQEWGTAFIEHVEGSIRGP